MSNVKVSDTLTLEFPIAGNRAILAEYFRETPIEGGDTGEPFAIIFHSNGNISFYTRDTSESHHIRIRNVNNVIKLNAEFLPDGLATEEYVNEQIASINLPELSQQVQSDWNEIDENSKAFIKNKPIIPNFEGYSTKDYVDNAVAQKTQVQIITWEADD